MRVFESSLICPLVILKVLQKLWQNSRINLYNEATRLFTVLQLMLKLKPAIASAIAKYHMTELGRKVVVITRWIFMVVVVCK